MYKTVYRKSKPIIVDGLEFPSITIAANTLMVTTFDLYQALLKGTFRGKPIRYKNVWDIPKNSLITPSESNETLSYKAPSEKPILSKSNSIMEEAFKQASETKETKQQKEKTMKKTAAFGNRAINVIIDGKTFTSMVDAGKYFNVSPAVISFALGHSKNRMWHGMKIAYEDEAKEAEVQAKFKSKVKVVNTIEQVDIEEPVVETPAPEVETVITNNEAAIKTARNILIEEAGRRLLNRTHSIAEVKQLLEVIEQL